MKFSEYSVLYLVARLNLRTRGAYACNVSVLIKRTEYAKLEEGGE